MGRADDRRGGSPSPDWRGLQGVIDGEVVLPGSPGYEAVRKPAVALFQETRPRAVVRCKTPDDAAATVALARRSGLPAAVRSGGHCFAGRSSTEGIVIDVTPMRSVSVADGVATVGSGTRLGDLYDSLVEREVIIPGGCGPTVGIAGLTLGGGLGILGRRYGLTCDHLVGAQVVLADGRVVECDQRHDQELFWALRGAGGGNFGVVTSLRFRTVPAPVVTSFHLVWPERHVAEVVQAWQDWAPEAPDELAASLLVTVAADLDRPPAANLFGTMLGTESDATALLSEVVARVGADPASASLQHLSIREAKRYLAELGQVMTGEATPDGQPPPPAYPYSKSEFFRRPLPAEAVAALVDHLVDGRVQGQSRELDFTPWGGAYNRVPTDATAFAHRDERFLLKQAAVVHAGTPPAAREAARSWLARSWALAHPWGSGGVYPNFPDPGLADWEHAYHGDNYDRLARVKASYDPDDFFSFPQSVRARPAPVRAAD
jgi:FAD/FMN-containing dehydrogenase